MEQSGRPVPVALRYRGARVDRAALERLVQRCLEVERTPPGRGIGLILAGGRLLRRLNRRWRGRDATTDVLSFPYVVDSSSLPSGIPADEPEARLLGEVLISVPRCVEQARRLGVDPGVELARLVIHGSFHVLGHDHELPAERRAMEAREGRLRRWAARRGLGPGILRIPPEARRRNAAPAPSGTRPARARRGAR